MQEYKPHKYLLNERFIMGFCGVFVTCTGLFSLIGHVLGITEYYTWGGDFGMAASTSVCFVMIGVSKIIISVSSRIWK